MSLDELNLIGNLFKDAHNYLTQFRLIITNDGLIFLSSRYYSSKGPDGIEKYRLTNAII